MARVTVEDCITIVQNRFELVALASQRTKDIGSGARLTVERDNDKNPVIALREIAGKNVDVVVLRESLIQGSQRKVKTDKFEEEPAAEDTMNANDLIEDVQTLGIREDLSALDGMSFEDENMDVDD